MIAGPGRLRCPGTGVGPEAARSASPPSPEPGVATWRPARRGPAPSRLAAASAAWAGRRGRPALPVDALDVLPGLADREHALVDVVERLDHRLDVAVGLEAAARQRDLELPHLVGVARLDEEFACDAAPPASSQPGEELVDLLGRARPRPALTARSRTRLVSARWLMRELGDDVGELAAAGRQRRRRSGAPARCGSRAPRRSRPIVSPPAPPPATSSDPRGSSPR